MRASNAGDVRFRYRIATVAAGHVTPETVTVAGTASHVGTPAGTRSTGCTSARRSFHKSTTRFRTKCVNGRTGPLEPLDPIMYLDALDVKMRDNGHVQNRAVYVAIGVNLEGRKEVLCRSQRTFWLHLLTELRNGESKTSSSSV